MATLKVTVVGVAFISGVVGAIFWWIRSTREKKNMEAFLRWKLVDFVPGHSPHE